MEQVRKNMADSRGADNPSDSPPLPPHSLKKDREKMGKKCMLATCAIGKEIPGQRYSLVGTGSLVRDFFIKNDKKVHLITSDEVISSEILSGYFLWFKKSNGRDKKKETLLSIGSEVIFKSPGLAVVPVDPQKIGRIRKHTSGLLHYRPFTLYDKGNEDARISGSYVHAVMECGNSFSIKPYPVEQISTEVERINLSLKSLGAPIVITSDGEARAMGTITRSDMQISRVLFSQIDRYRAVSDRSGAEGHQENENGQQGNQSNEEENGPQGNQSNEEENGQQGNQDNEEENGQQGNQDHEEENGQQGNQDNEEENGPQGNQSNEEENDQQGNQDHEEENGQQGNQGNKEENGQQGNQGNEEENRQQGNQGNEENCQQRNQGKEEKSQQGNQGKEKGNRQLRNQWKEKENMIVPHPHQDKTVNQHTSAQVRSGAAGHQGPEKTGVGEQPPGESVEEDGEQPTEELVEGGGEQSPVKPVEPVEGGGGKDGVELSNKGGARQKDKTNHLASQQTSTKASCFGNPTNFVDVRVRDNTSGEEGIPFARLISGKDFAKVYLGLNENDHPTTNDKDIGGGTRGAFNVSKEEDGFSASCKAEKGKGIHFSKLVGVEGGLAATVTFRDLEQQGGKDNDDQKNSDPRQDLLFGGSGENSSSFSLPGTSSELGCINDGIKKHGAGDQKNKREKRKCDSVNKDNNDIGGGTRGAFNVSKEEDGFSASCKAAKGKGLCVSNLVGVEGGLAATATFRDLKQEGGQDAGDQQNSNPRQGMRHQESTPKQAISGHPGTVSFLATAPSSFASTKGTTNYARLCRLLVDVGSHVLRSTFDKIHPPATLHTVLGRTSVHYARLQSLYRGRKKVLSLSQWLRLYPTHTPVSSAAFDISLLTVLLRNICGLGPPATGWHSIPPAKNISIADDIARVNYYRNTVYGHASQASVDDRSFSTYWHEIRGPLVRLGGADIRTAIDNLEHECMDPDFEEHYRERMKQWKKDDDSIKDKLEEMGDLLENISSTLEGKFRDATEKMGIEITEVKEKLSSLTTPVEKSRQADQLKNIESQRQELEDQQKEIGKQRICLDDQLKETEKQLQVLTNEIEETVEKRIGLEDLLEKTENELQETGEKRRNLTDQLKTTEERHRNLKDNFRETEERRKSLEDQLQEKEKQMKSLEDQLKKFEFQRQVLSEQLLNDTSPFCILPPKPSHDIASRDVEVADITNQLQELKRADASNLSILYICGNPGSGKSQLAGLVAKRFYEKAQEDSCSKMFVMTLAAETLDTLLDSYMMFARQMKCPEDAITQIHISKDLRTENKINSMISLISSKIGQYESWLLLADNVRSLSEMHVHLPQQGHGQWRRGYLLITTQDSACVPLASTSIRHISVTEGMQSQEASSLLALISGISDSEIGDKVARELDYQPLALASAATYVKQLRQSKRFSEFGWNDFLRKVEQGKRYATEALLTEISPCYQKSMTTVTTLAVKEVMQSDRIIAHALSFLSLLSSQPLNADIVVNYIVSVDEGIKDEEMIIKKLQRCSLILSHEDMFGFHIRVHQLVRDVVSSLIGDYPEIHHVKTLNSAIAAFDQFIDDNLPKESSGSIFQSYALSLHLKCFILSFENVLSKVSFPQIVQPGMEKLGKICENHCHYQAAKKFYEFSLQTFLQKFGPENTRVATSYNSLGLVHGKLGDFEKAKKYHELALSIAQKKLGPENVQMAACYNNLGLVHDTLGEFEKAKNYHESSLRIKQEKLGPENVQVAASYNNLGLVHDKMGDFEKAKEYYELALSIRQKELGPENVQVAAIYNNLGLVHDKLGDFEKAKEYHEFVLSITQKKLGPENVQVATSYNNLGSVHEQLGDFEKAKEYHELALSITQKKLGPDHVEVAASYNNLGLVHDKLGDFEKAKEYHELALSIRLKKLGPEDVQVAACYNNLGSLNYKLGDFQNAKEYQELALSITQKRLGPENVQVATSYNNLGSVHEQLGDFEKAKEYHELAWSIRQKKLGPESVQVAASYYNLGLVHDKLGDFEKAKEYHELARSIRQKKVGPVRVIDASLPTTSSLVRSVYSAQGIFLQAEEC